jgi:hypothetical protein
VRGRGSAGGVRVPARGRAWPAGCLRIRLAADSAATAAGALQLEPVAERTECPSHDAGWRLSNIGGQDSRTGMCGRYERFMLFGPDAERDA